jgi:hypothetical protein
MNVTISRRYQQSIGDTGWGVTVQADSGKHRPIAITGHGARALTPETARELAQILIDTADWIDAGAPETTPTP